MSERIKITDNITDSICKMGDGNPGAAKVMCALVKSDHLMDLLYLDSMKIYGSDIWIAFKDCCDSDIGKLHLRLEANDKDLIKEIKRAKELG